MHAPHLEAVQLLQQLAQHAVADAHPTVPAVVSDGDQSIYLIKKDDTRAGSPCPAPQGVCVRAEQSICDEGSDLANFKAPPTQKADSLRKEGC